MKKFYSQLKGFGSMKLDDVIIETDSEGNCTDEEDSEKKKEEERKL
jgi:hypothetical protein